MSSIAQMLFSDLPDWQNEFLDNLILCISEMITIAVIIILVSIYFTRRLKGFGLDIKTIIKDFFAAFVNLFTVWPLIAASMIITSYFGELFWGNEYQIQQHQQLKLLTEYSQLPLRIIIFIFAAVIASFFEEMLFRGLFQTTIRSYIEARHWSSAPEHKNSASDRYGVWLAIIISSGLFATSHANIDHWLALFVLGMCLGYAYEKSGSLFRPIFIHSLYNAISVLLVLNQ